MIKKPKDKKAIEKQKQEKRNKVYMKVRIILYSLCAVLAIYLIYTYNYMVNHPALHEYNPRLAAMEKDMIRGDILDRKGEKIAYSTVVGERVYPYGDLFFHIVGYNEPIKTGVEALANRYLLPRKSTLDLMRDELNNTAPKGYDVVTTLDTSFQKVCNDALENYRGSIIVLEPETGKIIASVSKPSVNPEVFRDEQVWKDYNDKVKYPDAPLLNRSLLSTYPPGSIYKIIPALGLIQEGKGSSFTYECTGTDKYESKKLSCYNDEAHGLVDLKKAFSVSCNNYFARAALELGQTKMEEINNQLMFNRTFDDFRLFMDIKKSQSGLWGEVTEAQLVESSIGQGKVLVTPMHMALLISGIANGGMVYEPYVIDEVVNLKNPSNLDDNKSVMKYTPKMYKTIMTSDEAKVLEELLGGVITDGTGWRTNINDDFITLYGKTGTAQNGTSRDHSWFIGYSKSEGKDIAVSILVEQGGTSYSRAVPIAKKIFQHYTSQYANGE